MPKSDLRIDILGISLSIAAEEDVIYLKNLLNNYRLAIENTQKSTGLRDPLKTAILTGFLLCDEIERIRKREVRDKEVEQLTLDMIARIDEALEQEG
ncbi:MAG: cell division protein ZapA [Treponema sp.]|nr:cell division protein ZapA [Treponema sp.]